MGVEAATIPSPGDHDAGDGNGGEAVDEGSAVPPATALSVRSPGPNVRSM
jgi:hypothetical protein